MKGVESIVNMKFTIGTVSNSLDLTEDLNLIKSSILYADEVELIGLAEYALYKYLPDHVFNVQNFYEMIPVMRTFLQNLKLDGCEELLQQLNYIDEQLQFYTPYLKKKKDQKCA